MKHSQYERIEVEPLSGAIGGIIHGVDCGTDLTDEVIEEIRFAWLQHLVIFFRDQQLSPDQQLAFARRLGDVVAYPMVKGLTDFPEVVPVIKYPSEQFNFGGLWHADTTYLEEPPMAGLLLAREVPPVGGDTLFANMYLAYETLSGGMQSLVDRLTVVQSSAKPDAARSREKRVKANAKEEGRVFVAEHPAVKVHPETGRKALYVNFGHSVRFKEMTEEESQPILDYLFRHQVRPEFTCRFRWTEGAMALWDNRCTQHNPMNDYHGSTRVMHRISIG